MKYMNQATEDRRPARIAMSVALAGALVTMSLVSLLPASHSRADTLCIAPTPTASSTETPPGPGLQAADAESDRSVTLAVDRGMVTTGGFVTMTGTLTAADGTCVPGTKVKIEAETVGSSIPSKGGKGETNDEGVFVATVKVGASAEYTAVAPGETKEDEDVLSAPVTVLSRVVMTAKARDLTPERGKKFEIAAQVRPPHPGSEAMLQRKTDSGWRNVLKDKSNATGFKFKLKAKWKGKRVFRVTWIKSDEDHEPGSSARLKIKTVKPKKDGRRNRGR